MCVQAEESRKHSEVTYSVTNIRKGLEVIVKEQIQYQKTL